MAIHYCGKCGAWAILGSDPAAQADIYPDNYAVLEAAKTEPTGQHTYVDGECSCGANENCEHTKHTRTQRAKAATCTEAGAKYDVYKCNDCNVTWCNTPDGRVYNFNKNDVVLPAEHDYGTGVDCVVCGERKPGVRACDHSVSSQDWVMVQAYQEVDCINDGMNPIYKCSICGIYGSLRDSGAVTYGSKEAAEEDLTIAARGKHVYKNGVCTDCGDCKNGHKNTVEIPATEATCTMGPKSAGVKCAVCDKVLVAPKATGGALKHDYDEGVITKAATCTEEGVKTISCLREGCSRSYTESVPVLKHQWKNIGYKKDHEATCEKVGLFLMECELCGEKTTQDAPAVECEFEAMEEIAPKCGVEGRTGGLKCKWCGGIKEEPQTVAALKHSFDEGTVTTAAACGKTGVMTYKCTREGCKATDTKTIDKLPHKWDEGTVTTAAACGKAGVKTYKCTREGCKATETEAIPQLYHVYDNGTVTTEPECGKAGVKTFKCVNEGCKVSKTEPVAQLYHEYDSSVTTAPTCTTTGIKTYVCKHCGLTTTEVIEATGHKITNDMSTLIGELLETPTCQTEGKGKFRCQNEGCKAWSKLKVPAVDHEYITWPGFGATCTKTGRTNGEYCKYCKTDSVKTQRQVIPVLEHDYNVWIRTTKEATCLEDGSAVFKCFSDCNGYLELPVEKLGHDDKVLENWPATCTSNGCTKYECQREGCTEKIRYVDSKATGHTPEVLPAVEATCSITGLTEGEHCTTCFAILVEQESIEKKAHTWTDVEGVNATCTENGYTSHKKCSVCGTVEGKSVIEASHYYNNVRCTVCGEANPESEATVRPGTSTGTTRPGTTTPDRTPDDSENNGSMSGSDNNTEDSTTGGSMSGTGSSDDSTSNGRPEGVVPACGHSHTTTVTQAKTCTSNGSIITYCTDCNTVVTTTVDAATGHNYVLGICATCKAQDPSVYTGDYNNYYIVGNSGK